MLLSFIVGCEIAFWVFLLAGLVVRYQARMPRSGALLLVFVPLIDLFLLGATIIHLRSGAVADLADGLAAAYIGFSVVFGPSLVRGMDARFAYRFADGPKPPVPPKYGRAKVRYEWQLFRKALAAWGISCALLLGGFALVGGGEPGAALLGWIARLTLVLLVWLIWPVSYALWPGKPKAGQGTGPGKA